MTCYYFWYYYCSHHPFFCKLFYARLYTNILFYILTCNKIVYLLLLMFLHIWGSSLTASFLFGTVEYIDNFLFIKIYNIWAENIFRQHRRIFFGFFRSFEDTILQIVFKKNFFDIEGMEPHGERWISWTIPYRRVRTGIGR